MTEIVGKRPKHILCTPCLETLRDYEGPVHLCEQCAYRFGADMVVGVNGSHVHLLKEADELRPS